MPTLKQEEERYIAAKEAYYIGKETMSDAQFDSLERWLEARGSDVIKQVGSKAAGTIPHLSLMLSLGKINVYDDETKQGMNEQYLEFCEWFDKAVAKGATSFEGSCKYDGNAINLIYKDGVMNAALKRTDKEVGFDVRDKLVHLVPATIPFDGTLEIRGEVLILKELFDKKYSKEALGEKDGASNARNFVGGKLSTDKVNLSVVKDLAVVLYDVRIHQGNTYFYPTKVDTMTLLTKLGFNLVYPPFLKTFTKKEEFFTLYHQFKQFREDFSEFLLDGMVIKANEASRSDIGYTSHHPKWAIAVKFPPKDEMTEIVGIDWKTGSSGEVVPTAMLKPLELDGTIVKRAALFNKGKVIERSAWPGAKVLVAKAGDIIPQIYEIVQKSDTPGVIPTHCPTCKSTLYEDDVHLWCLNEDCPAQVLSKLESGLRMFKTKKVGQSAIKKLFPAGIKRVEDFFDKKKFNRSNLIRSGQFVDGRSLDIVLDAVNKIDSVKLTSVIQSMKITDVGEAVSKQVAKKMSGLEYDTSGLTGEAWTEVTDKTKKGYQRLQEYLILLKENFINVEYEQDVSTLKTFEMTGSPPTIGNFKSKEDYIEYFRKFGYMKAKLTAESDYLITDSMSSTTGKMTTAANLQTKGSKIKVMTYRDFIESEIGNKTFFDVTDDAKDTPQTALF